ncbi:peroxiredoxin [bacterium]|nr:peroxiredoxin [bacterium]
MRATRRAITALACLLLSAQAAAGGELKPGDPAPVFRAKTQDGADFDLAQRAGQWTVLYFYPRAGTPGCTKQADGFRDGLAAIRERGAEVFGISTDTVEAQARFHQDEQLSFTLLADPDGAVAERYGAKMPLLTVAKRWTFIIDPHLTIRQIERDVDPPTDARRVAAALATLERGATPAPRP